MLKMKSKHDVLAKAQAICRDNSSRLLYLAYYGSTLYGTAIPGRSDLDCKGLYLPSPQSLALGKAPDSLRFSTGDSCSHNTADDVDVDLWSLQYWLLKLLAGGDTGAMDLLFSPSHAECVVYRSGIMDEIFAEPLKVLNLAGGRSYVGYCLGQAERYCLKGERLRVLQRVRQWLDRRHPDLRSGIRLEEALPGLLEACRHGEYCHAGTSADGMPALVLNGKIHLAPMPLKEFSQRLDREIAAYGERARAAEASGGLDFKALSHSVRVVSEMQEILATGRVVFPLACAGELRSIREGRLSRPAIDALIRERLALAEKLQDKSPYAGAYDPARAPALVLKAYGLAGDGASGGPAEDAPGAPQAVARQKGLDAVPGSLLRQIQDRLDAIERESHVRILYACESGSRAWGCPSKDSDWDVRMVYMHEPDWYLDVAEKKDVVDAGIKQGDGGVFDVSGWDLRKALRLYGGSNAAIQEWLASPLVYRRQGPLLELLRRHASTVFSPIAAWHHYRSLVAGMLQKDPDPQARSVKRWMYILRPLLVLRWLERHEGVPPMTLAELLAQAEVDASLKAGVGELVQAKLASVEKGAFAPAPAVLAFAAETWDRVQSGAFKPAPAKGRVDLGQIFRTCLRAWPVPPAS